MKKQMTDEERQKLQEGAMEQFTKETAEICVCLKNFDEIDWDKMFEDYSEIKENTNDMPIHIDLNYHRIISVLNYQCHTDWEIEIRREIDSVEDFEKEVRDTIHEELALAPRFDENFSEEDLLVIYPTVNPNGTFAEFIRNATGLETIDDV